MPWARTASTRTRSFRYFPILAASLLLAIVPTAAPSEPPQQETATSTVAQARAMWLGRRVCLRKLMAQEVIAGTPAATAGIQAGERIYSVNGESNIEDIHDDLNEVGLTNAVLVVVGNAGETPEVPILAAVRPTSDLRHDETIYLPERTIADVEPGSPYAAIDCRERCSAVVQECEPVLIQSQGAGRLYAKWRDKLVTYDGDFWGRVFTDPTPCRKEAQARCSFFL